MDVSIILVNYNTADLLLACIASIIEKTNEISYEIIVVDNASADSSVEKVRAKFPSVKVIANNDNVGFGRANNLGVAHSEGKYVWFLNSDTLLINNAAKILFESLFSYPNAGIAGGNLYDGEMKPNTSFYQTMPGLLGDVDYLLFNVFTKIKYNKNLNFNYSNRILEIDGFITGADLMIEKALFEEIGGFDKDFFMYYEETELTYRVRLRGLKVISVPDAKIIHLEGASETKKENSIRRTFESKFKYINKTNLKGKKKLLRLIFKLTSYQRYILYKCLGKENKSNAWALTIKVEKDVYKRLQ
ncbi:glycosyltransferase family 2 protein [Pedobacter xixiisoli]|uniref:Glycosyltransferase 2-like domain-containing protein n=1 Tax=Pedobacter xixiisoli TaxID=1476464 RepID=A0A286AEM3_9SPHI|nr:glycosyltransferase family 2 protein [Pedobacter xixiisoli]SOD20337.1 hypothetical protein SAMN06297358_4053 [Pedobacter xixiisoli]